MKKMLLKWFLLIMWVVSSALPLFASEGDVSQKRSEGGMIFLSIVAELSVTDTEKTVLDIIAFGENNRGYYTRKTDKSIELRIPFLEKDKLQKLLEEKGYIITYNVTTKDLTEEYEVIKRKIASREKLLSQYKALTSSANFSSALSLEREMSFLLTETENFKGQRRRMENDGENLKLNLYFYSQSSGRPQKGDSVFPWINSIDFYTFMTGYEKGWKPFVSPLFNDEEGSGSTLAVAKKWGKTIYYSADGFKAETRTEKNRLKKDTYFWAEALKTQLTGEGYYFLDEKESDINGRTIVEFTWLVPFGSDYYKYVTAISASKNKIYIVEASAEKVLFDAYSSKLEEIISSALIK